MGPLSREEGGVELKTIGVIVQRGAGGTYGVGSQAVPACNCPTVATAGLDGLATFLSQNF